MATTCDLTLQIGAKEVCGCPMDPKFPSVRKECGDFCKQPRKSCIKHYCWEKLRRAEIDQEKLNLVSLGSFVLGIIYIFFSTLL